MPSIYDMWNIQFEALYSVEMNGKRIQYAQERSKTSNYVQTYSDERHTYYSSFSIVSHNIAYRKHGCHSQVRLLSIRHAQFPSGPLQIDVKMRTHLRTDGSRRARLMFIRIHRLMGVNDVCLEIMKSFACAPTYRVVFSGLL